MTSPIDPQAAAQAVLWGGLVLGCALGAVTQATRFCTMGAVADWFAYRGTARLAMWALAVAVAATGTLGLIGMQWLDATRTLPWSPRFNALAYLAGGAIFGCGMVLASGCPQRSLVKAGAGSLKAAVTVLVVALAAEMTLRGVLAEVRVGVFERFSLQLPVPQDGGSLLAVLTGGAPTALRTGLLVTLWLAVAALLWRCRASLERSHWVGGVLVGLLVVAAWALTGHVGFVAEHPETLEAAWMGTYSRRPEALSFAAPLAHGLSLLTLWTDRSNTLSFGVMLALGVPLGSALSARWRGEFRIESFRDAEDLTSHLLGALLMGFGGVTAMGCSIGQGVSGLSLLSAGSGLAVLGIVAGAWLALKVQAWRIERG